MLSCPTVLSPNAPRVQDKSLHPISHREDDGDPGPWAQSRGTELPRVEGTTHHTVPRVRNWQRLHHQIHPGCLPRKTKNTSVRGPKGRVQVTKAPTPGAIPSGSACVPDSLAVQKSLRTNKEACPAPCPERAVGGDSDHWLRVISQCPRPQPGRQPPRLTRV